MIFEASDLSREVDTLFLAIIFVCGIVFFGIVAAMLYLSLKYKKDKLIDRSSPPLKNLKLELSWTLPTLLIFLIFFVWGAQLYRNSHEDQAVSQEIFVTGKQWMWKFQHPGGQKEIDELHLPVGEPVKLIMISEDVIHSFFLPDFRIKQDLLPGRYTKLIFTPNKTGTFRIYCSQYCGARHSYMLGKVIIQSKIEFDSWRESRPVWSSGSQNLNAGQKVFTKYGCNACHSIRPKDVLDENLSGPTLWNLYQSKVTLHDGKVITADENYIRESIFHPNAKVVKGFSPQMPTFEGLIPEEEMQALQTYMKSLRAGYP